MLQTEPEFSLVIPLYNEAACAKRSVQDILDALEAHVAGRYELILVINGSTDGTGAICESFAQRYPHVKTVRFNENQGYGGGILGGLAHAQGTYCGFTCGDGQAPPEVLIRLLSEIAGGEYDVVKATRIKRRDGLARSLQSAVYNWMFRWIFQVPSRDINAMPKLLRREVYEQLALESTDWFIDAEIMIKAHHGGWRILEVPAESLGRIGGASTVRLGTCFEFLVNAVRILWSGKFNTWKRMRATPLSTLSTPTDAAH